MLYSVIKGELPYNAFLTVCISLVLTASMMIYPRILAFDAPKAEIERFLFYSSYEVDYCLKAFAVPKDKLTIKNQITVFGIIWKKENSSIKSINHGVGSGSWLRIFCHSGFHGN